MSGRSIGTAGMVLAMAMSASPVSAQSAVSRAYVLDAEPRTVTAIDVATGRTEVSAPLEGTPSTLLRTSDGRRLLVLDRGVGKDAFQDGYKATTKSAVTILDGRTLKVQQRVELGWGLEPGAMLHPAGTRLSVVCTGYVGKTAAESLAREIVSVDLATGAVVRAALPRRVHAAVATPDGTRAALLSHRQEAKNVVSDAELRIVDLARATTAATVALPGDPRDPVTSFDGKYVYLLDKGKPSSNPVKHVGASVHVVSVEKGVVAHTAEVGANPQGFVLDEKNRRLLLLSDTAPMKGAEPQSQLRAISGAVVSAPTALPPRSWRILASDDGQRLHVVGEHSLVTLSASLRAEATVDLEKAPWSTALVSNDGRRLFRLDDDSIHTADAQSGQSINKVKTGRGGKRFLLMAQAVGMGRASQAAAASAAQSSGQSSYTYTVYALREADSSMSMGPGGKFVYALNQQTSDVTVVDANSGVVIEKVAAGGFQTRFLTAASTLLVVSGNTVHTVDLASHKKTGEIGTASREYSGADVSPDGSLAVVQGLGGVLTVNGASGKAQATGHDFKRVAGVVVAWAPR